MEKEKMAIHGAEKPKQSVYVQMRQAVRDKDGRIKVTKTKTITIHNATIEQVRKILERST